MRITDSIDLLYPNDKAKKYAAERRKTLRESGSMFIRDLQIENLKSLISLTGAERFVDLAEELSDDADTVNYRLDCLEDFLSNPDISQSFRKIIGELSGRNLKIDETDEYIDSFLDIKNKMDDLSFFLTPLKR